MTDDTQAREHFDTARVAMTPFRRQARDFKHMAQVVEYKMAVATAAIVAIAAREQALREAAEKLEAVRLAAFDRLKVGAPGDAYAAGVISGLRDAWELVFSLTKEPKA